jgi:hypothetical protein
MAKEIGTEVATNNVTEWGRCTRRDRNKKARDG